MNGCIVIRYDESYKQYTYDYKEESCSDVAAVPIITLKGETTMTVGRDEVYTDPGYSATYKGNDVTSDVVVTGTVNTDTVGTYTLEYSVICDGKSAKKYRTVHVEVMYRTFRQVMEPLLGTEVNNNDPDENLRYVGSDPDNYVEFNGDLWRVIGLFSNEYGEQPKIIQDEPYYQDIEWDDDSNDWTTATLQTVLNSTYLNSIDSVSKSYIDQNYEWKLGGINTWGYSEMSLQEFYEGERGTKGSENRPVIWQGAIGLMYPSDYGYSTSGDMSICNSVTLYYWGTDEFDDWNENLKYSGAQRCRDKLWLYNSSYRQWTLTADYSYDYILAINTSGSITLTHYDNGSYVDTRFETASARPTLYLKSNVVIVDGTGDSQDPYILDIVS